MRLPLKGLGNIGISASGTYFVPENMYQNLIQERRLDL